MVAARRRSAAAASSVAAVPSDVCAQRAASCAATEAACAARSVAPGLRSTLAPSMPSLLLPVYSARPRELAIDVDSCCRRVRRTRSGWAPRRTQSWRSATSSACIAKPSEETTCSAASSCAISPALATSMAFAFTARASAASCVRSSRSPCARSSCPPFCKRAPRCAAAASSSCVCRSRCGTETGTGLRRWGRCREGNGGLPGGERRMGGCAPHARQRVGHSWQQARAAATVRSLRAPSAYAPPRAPRPHRPARRCHPPPHHAAGEPRVEAHPIPSSRGGQGAALQRSARDACPESASPAAALEARYLRARERHRRAVLPARQSRAVRRRRRSRHRGEAPT